MRLDASECVPENLLCRFLHLDSMDRRSKGCFLDVASCVTKVAAFGVCVTTTQYYLDLRRLV